MAQELNIQDYTAPIIGENPSGEDLKYTPVYDDIKEAKRADDQLDRGDWQTDLKTSDWRLTMKLCSDALINRSKDLQITAWFTESLLFEQGFGGLAFGLELLSALMSEYWDTLYPEIKDDDLDYRVGPLIYLNEKLPEAIYCVPLCDPTRTRGFNHYELEESRIVGVDDGLDTKQKARRQKMLEQGKISADEFASAVNQSSFDFYTEIRNQLEACHDQLIKFDDLVTEKFASDPPGFTQLFKAVEACQRIVEKIYTEKKKSEVPETDAENIEDQNENKENGEDNHCDNINSINLFPQHKVISDITADEKTIWNKVIYKADKGDLKTALDSLMAAAMTAPSIRQKNRYLLLVAKLCLRADRPDLAKPILEELHELVETLNLEKWEHPTWIADVIETLYQCLEKEASGQTERVTKLFQKLCTLNITKAAAHRLQV